MSAWKKHTFKTQSSKIALGVTVTPVEATFKLVLSKLGVPQHIVD